ncbi:toll/interleukin-1 receptor domain-containing protein [Altererythrobacter sp.]|uniref:toll/interleukin-1 receptor domain-containing protein n=1 Tax=Altererythrobacter sp. TaxID=1872480 RepID=UPI001B00BF51|nr:toll/interleukin-1 receptor domain-containing protein [Altererythrobacter sp.]MBO6609552.1 toll/interleukin-1 receptor domain-containing protein [Altererythrobacter sp.]MBO6641833.1 toll/interleukin-1 receptor domain-containing protein [Altererythrobacter sp.]MBO6709779.1 toll/interleukin-1 receptor domain-containing protein [Altererythrobacter sp.]MBO6944230.1 toll/interleukin-1 receptor domain-containing protein [Altererythrobacter sp.]
MCVSLAATGGNLGRLVTDIFISYARSTQDQARAAARNLESLGYSVWIDDALPAQRAFSSVIEEGLRESKAKLTC